MYYRTYFFLLFIIASMVFFLASFFPALTLAICNFMCGSLCSEKLSAKYIELTSMLASAISLIFFVISNYITEKKLAKEKVKLAVNRQNIEQIHAELEALKN